MSISPEQLALEREKFEFIKERLTHYDQLAEVSAHAAHKATIIRYVIIILVLLLLLFFFWPCDCATKGKQTGTPVGGVGVSMGEQFSPFPSTLIHDSPRSDPAYDSARDGYLTEKQLFQLPHPLADSLYS